MNIIILIKLLFAHLFSDFILQSNRLCQGKRKDGHIKWAYLIPHSLTHAVMAYLLVAQWYKWIVPAIIFSTHLIIDYIKSKYQKDNIKTFLTDQIFHIVVIFALWLYLCDSNTILKWIWCNLSNINLWYVITAYLLILKPTSILLCLFIKKWTQDENNLQSLPNAGKWIGYLERILILTFILTKNIEGVGFLLAAKSIFRFGELNKAKDIKTTEYVLIGTFSSFTIAILVGVITTKLMQL